jgi:hypothetical protein
LAAVALPLPDRQVLSNRVVGNRGAFAWAEGLDHALMKEDVLEQVVEDYLQLCGYFTRHNLRFKPDRLSDGYAAAQDSVPSDVDVVGFKPGARGAERVWVVSCKSWQTGFDPSAKLKEMRQEKKNPKRETWRGFREL